MTYVAKWTDTRFPTVQHLEFQTEQSAVEFLIVKAYFGHNPLGVWEDGDKILSHDDILEWGEDDETI